MCWASGWPTPMRWPTGRISPPSPWVAGSSSPVISSWRGSMNRQPKRRKYFSGYFKDSVVFVCVAKGGMNNGKETSQRRGQHPKEAQRRWRADTLRASIPTPAGHPEKRVRPDAGRVQGKAGESHPDNRGIPMNHNEDYTVAEWCRLWFENLQQACDPPQHRKDL